MKERLLSISTALLLICYGCDEGESFALVGQLLSAENAVFLTAQLDALVENPESPEALIGLSRIFTELNAFATAGQEPLFASTSAIKAPLDQCVTVEGSRIEYNDCVVSNGTVDGTVIAIGDQLEFDLIIASQSTSAGSLSVAMNGALTLTDVLLEGQLFYETVIGGLEEFPDGLVVDLQAEYLAIQLDAERCPIAGALLAQQEALGSATLPQEAVFGPSCGDVRLVE